MGKIDFATAKSVFQAEPGETKRPPFNGKDTDVVSSRNTERPNVESSLREQMPRLPLNSYKIAKAHSGSEEDSAKLSDFAVNSATLEIERDGLDDFLVGKYVEIGAQEYYKDLLVFLLKNDLTPKELVLKRYLAKVLDLEISENGKIRGGSKDIVSKVHGKFIRQLVTSFSQDDLDLINSGKPENLRQAAENILGQFEGYDRLWRNLETKADDNIRRQLTPVEALVAKAAFFHERADWYDKFLGVVAEANQHVDATGHRVAQIIRRHAGVPYPELGIMR